MAQSISEAIFLLVFRWFFWIVGLIGSIVMYPIQLILVTLIPRSW